MEKQKELDNKYAAEGVEKLIEYKEEEGQGK